MGLLKQITDLTTVWTDKFLLIILKTLRRLLLEVFIFKSMFFEADNIDVELKA